MDTKATSIVAYLTWIGLLLAILAGDKEGAKFHINQALVILLFSLLSIIPAWDGFGESSWWYAGSWDWLRQSTRKKKKFRSSVRYVF